MNDEPMVIEGKTVTGQMDYKLAAALCYLPVSFLHLIAAAVWLLTEPKESRFVRFHAVQSLILFAVMFGGSIGSLVVGMLLVPALCFGIGMVLAGLLGDELGGAMGGLFALFAMISYFGGALLSILFSLGFIPSFLITGFFAFSGKEARLPVLGRLAMRFV